MTDKTKEFINKAIKVHGNKYDYSKVKYENNLKEVIIICKVHGDFLQLPKTHKRGNGCIECGREKTVNSKKSNTEDFIKKANIIHHNKYNYSKVIYNKAIDKVIIICEVHGEFLQTPNTHLDGSGCYDCGKLTMAKKQSLTKDEFIEKSIKIHGNNYDYSKVEYINNNTNIIIICKEHGEFSQTPQSHLTGSRCYECSIISSIEKRTKTTSNFIEESIKKYGNIFDYSKTVYKKCDENIIIICKEHGEFEQTPSTHLNSSYCCPKCVSNNIGKCNNSNSVEFIEKAIKIHGNKYDYSKVKYIKANHKVIIICKEHGDFEQVPNSHLNGNGCYNCGKLTMAKKQSLTKDEFIEKSIDIHGNIYDYSKV
jgi:hypothetical protein